MDCVIKKDSVKFYTHFHNNVNIDDDGTIASVTFDYSYWKDKKKINWGKESWGLVKIEGQ